MKRTMGTGKVATFAAFCLGAAAAFAYDCPNALVEYVEADGVSQYADTGVLGNADTKVEAVMEWVEVPTDSVFLGARLVNDKFYPYNYWVNSGAGGHRISYIGELYSVSGTQTATAGVKYKIESFLEGGRQELTVYTDNAGEWEETGHTLHTTNRAVKTGMPMYLFALNKKEAADGESYVTAFSKARVYSLKIWQKSGGEYELVRDYQPCLNGDRPGLWDKVEGTITYASGTGGDFTAGARIPYEPDAYLDYVEATGTQYIDTGVNAEKGLKARLSIRWDSKPAGGAILGARKTYGTADNNCYLFYFSGSYMWCSYSYWNSMFNTSVEPTYGRRVEYVTDFTATNNLQVYYKGRKTLGGGAGSGVNANVNAQRNLCLFALNDGGTVNNYGKGKLYELKILKQNADTGNLDLIRHYLPCLKCGKAGLYDAVNETISFSQGADDFVPGDVLTTPCEFVEWIESDGGKYQYIDTWAIGKSGTKSVVDCSVRAGFSKDQAILAGRLDKNNRIFPAYFIGNYFGYGYINGYWGSSGTANQVAVGSDPSARFLIESDLDAGRQSVKVNGTELHMGDSHVAEYISTERSLTLFALNGTSDGSDGRTDYSSIRLYSAKIWDGDELLRDFAPCVASDGRAGLYDSVTRRMFYMESAASGDPEVSLDTNVGGCTNSLALASMDAPDKLLDYIESDGVQDYFDTGVLGNAGVKMEAVMSWVEVPSDAIFIGSRKADTGSGEGHEFRFFPYNYWVNPNGNVSSHRFSYGHHVWSAVKDGAGVPATAGVKYKIETTMENGSQTISVSEQNAGVWEEVASQTESEAYAIDTDLPMYLFARNMDGVADAFAKARVYSLKLWTKSGDEYVLARDLVPAKACGKVLLYDNVTKSFYRNRGRYHVAGKIRVENMGLMLMFK